MHGFARATASSHTSAEYRTRLRTRSRAWLVIGILRTPPHNTRTCLRTLGLASPRIARAGGDGGPLLLALVLQHARAPLSRVAGACLARPGSRQAGMVEVDGRVWCAD
jgi:hypothetical protein